MTDQDSPTTNRAETPEEADVVVVGGGIMGTSTAFFLATETDLDTVLLERGRLAGGSTGDSSAIIRHHYGGQTVYTKTAYWSSQFYREFEANVGSPIAHADNELVRFANEGTQAGEYTHEGYELMSELGIPASEYEQPELASRYPMLSLEEYDFGVSDETAAYSDGADVALAFARAAGEAGASIVTGTAVERILTSDGAVTGVETEDGTVSCDDVVVTAGPWTQRLAESVDVSIPFRTTREQVIILDPPESFRKEHLDALPTTAKPGGDWYIRPDFGDGVLVATHHTGSDVDPDNYDDSPDESQILHLTDQLEEFVPELADAGLKGQYCGIYSTTPDHDFIIDSVGPDGCHVGCGFSGHGFKHAPAVGKILSELASTGESETFDIEYFSFERFEKNPDGHGVPKDLA